MRILLLQKAAQQSVHPTLEIQARFQAFFYTSAFFQSDGGEYTGQLGPWAGFVKTIGIEPRSTLMKTVFVAYGLSALTAATGFGLDQPSGRNLLIVISILGLWYLPVGTAANMTALILLFLTGGKHARTSTL